MKKVLLLGFILVLLIAIPVTVFLIQQQSKTKSGATAATTISILPASQDPIKVGDKVSLDIQVNPATATTANIVELVQFTIMYDSTKLATDGAGFVANTATGLPNISHGPIYGDGTISVTLSTNGDVTKVIQKLTTIGTINFKAIAITDTPSQITFGNDVLVQSIGTTDIGNENVLSSANPAALTIVAGAEPTATPTPTPTAEPTATPTPTPTAEPTAAQTNVPTCTNLTADVTSGTAPLSTNLTATGSSSNSTISKITFNFGDGQSQDITESGGIGTNSVSVLQSHSYATAGTFQATAILTDAANAVSDSTSCKVAITVGGVTAAPTATPTEIAQVSPLPPTGPADLVKVGSIGAIITLIGAVLLFAL
jgi:hypothetical protein